MNKYEPKLIATVTSVFNTFDQDQKGMIKLDEIGNVIRALGVYPTDTEVRNYLMQMSKDTACQNITRENFIEFMCDLIARDQNKGPSRQELEQAFLLLDPENKGRIDENTIRVQLASQGEKFSADEIEQFINFAKDNETGQVDWRGYIDTVIDILWRNQ